MTGQGYRDHTNRLFWQLKCLEINDIYRLEMVEIMYRIHTKMITSFKPEHFKLIENYHTHDTRQRRKSVMLLQESDKN